MKTIPSRYEHGLAILLLLYCIYNLVTALSLGWGFTTDDAYISWVYARHLVEGDGLTWHSQMPRVEGFSNFLWTIIAALVLKLQLPLVLSMKWIGVISLVASLSLLYKFARLFMSPLLAMLPVFIFSHYLGVVWWTLSGLESLFYVAWSIMLNWQLLKAWGYSIYPEDPKRYTLNISSWFWVSFSLLVLSLTRFEGVIWIIPVVVFSTMQLRNNEAKPHLKSWLLISLFTFIIPYTIYFLWRLSYFGHLIPNSYQCKALAKGQVLIVDWDYFEVTLPYLIAALPYLVLTRDSRKMLLWLPSILYAFMLWRSDPVVAYFLRIFLPPFALFTLLPVLGIRDFISYLKPNINPQWLVVVIIFLITFLFSLGNERVYIQQLTEHYQERSEIRLAAVDLLNQQAKKNALVLLGDCGIIPFMSRKDLRFLDAQCLNNAEYTQNQYHQHLERYAHHLKTTDKPDWLIINYYPLEHRGDYLEVLLKAENFFNDYQLVKTLQSGMMVNRVHVIDYEYRIYQRIH